MAQNDHVTEGQFIEYVNEAANQLNNMNSKVDNIQKINAFNWKGNKDTYADLLLLTDLEVNDGYGVIADGLVYVWNGEAFPDDGDGLNLGLKPDENSKVAEGNPMAVSGGEVFLKLQKNKIGQWTAKVYTSGEQVIHNDTWWEAVVDTTAPQEPGVVAETIWKPVIKGVELNTEVQPNDTTKAPTGKAVADYVLPLLDEKLGVDTTGIKKSYNILDLKNVIQPGAWNADTGVHNSAGNSGTRYVATKTIPVKSNTTYHLSRKTAGMVIPQSAAVAVFFDSNMVFIGSLLQSEYAPTKTITTPQDTAYMGLNIAYGAATSYEEKRDFLLQDDTILSEGADIKDFVPYGYYIDSSNTIDTDKYVYLSPTGDDLTADGSINNPFKTTSKALSNGFKKYLLLDGTYLSNDVSMPNGGELVAVNSGKAIVHGGSNQIIDDVTLHEDTIYKVPLTEAIHVNRKNFWIKDIPDATTLISDSQRLPQDGNDTHRLKSTRLIRLDSYEDLQAFDGIATFSDSTMLYIKGIGGLVSASNPIIIVKSGLDFNGKTLIKGVKFEYLGITINNVTEMVDCSLMYVAYSGVTVGSNGGYGIFKNCRIGGVNNNGIGYNSSGNAQGREIGCYIHDCTDQGSSAHGTASVYRENSVYTFCNEGTADVGRVKIHFNGCAFLWNNRDIRFTFSGTPDNGNALIVNCSGNAPIGVMSGTPNNLLVMNSSFTGSMSSYATVI